MREWASCVICQAPVIGAGRLDARVCGQQCATEVLVELVRLEASLGLPEPFSGDADVQRRQAMLARITDVATLAHRSRLLHAVRAWQQVEATATRASSAPPAEPPPMSRPMPHTTLASG